MTRQTKKWHTPSQNAQALPEEVPEPPPDLGPPPDTDGRVSEVTTTPNTQGNILVLNQTLKHAHAPPDNVNMTTVNHKTGEVCSMTTEVINASEHPMRDTMHHCHDEHVNLCLDETTGHSMESSPTAALMATDFYAHMSAIMAGFSNTISTKLVQTIDANQETSQESTRLIHNKI